MRRHWGVLLAASLPALLVLAGCGGMGPGPGGGADPTSSPGVTAAPVPGGEGRGPAGVVDGRVRDPRALATAHARALEGRSFTLVSEREARYTNGTLRGRLRLRATLAADRGYRADVVTAGPAAPVFLGRPPATATFWSNGDGLYLRKLTRRNTTVFNRFTPRQGGAGGWRYWVRTVPFGGQQATPTRFYTSVFRSVPVQLAEREQTNGSDGPVVYRFVGRGLERQQFDEDLTNVRKVRLNATVTQQGLVRSLSLRYVGDIDGATVRVTQTVRYSRIGDTSVSRPEWFDRAVQGDSEPASSG
jgi:hypothetical protein